MAKYIFYLSFSKIFWVLHLTICPTTSDLSISPALASSFIISNKIFLPFFSIHQRPGPSSYLCSARCFPFHQLSPKLLESGGNTAPAWHFCSSVPGAVQEGSQQHCLSFMAQGERKCSLRESLPHHFLGRVVLALGNNWHCSLLWGRMHRAGFWLDSPCWAVQSLTFSPISPRLCLLVLLKQLTGAGILITSYTQWWLQIENQTNLRIHPIPNPAEA